MKNTTSTNSIRTRIIATILSATCMLSTVSLLASTSASAVEVNTPSISATSNKMIASPISDGFFSGASTCISILSKSNPVTAIISNGLLGAFKTFYGDATKTPSPTTADIVNLINQLSEKIDSHHNEEMQQLSCISDQIKLQDFANNLNSIVGYNKASLKHLGNCNDNLSEEDYKLLIKETINKEGFIKSFTDISNLITNGSMAIKAKPAFEQYLELSKNCSSNSYNYDFVKKDSELFMQMTLEQYTLMYTSIMTGYMAEYNLANVQYQNNEITKDVMESRQKNVVTNMNLYTDYGKAVVESYEKAMKSIEASKTTEITINGTTTPKYSFADTWVDATKTNGNSTIKLFKDWDAKDLGSDTCQYKANSSFTGKIMHLTNGSANITIDLNGHSIRNNDENREYDLLIENSNITIIDSTHSKTSSISGIFASNSTITVDGITIKDSTGTGIRLTKNSKATIKNSTFSNCKNSAIVCKEGSVANISGCNFTGNLQSAVYNTSTSVFNSSRVTIDNCTFVGNSTDKNGGAVYNDDDVKITNSTFKDNKANNGGAIYTNNSLDVKGCTFTNNTASNNGGGICTDYRGNDNTATTKVDGCKMTQNTANNKGGGIYADSMSYLNMFDTEITNNTAGSDGAGLFAQKGSGSSCDPTIGGKITIINNHLTNGTNSNAFLQENSTSKCIFKLSDDRKLDSNSRIGITSNTSDKTLDVVKIFSKDSYNRSKNVFSYDTSKYHINRYTHWYSDFWWVEIVRN